MKLERFYENMEVLHVGTRENRAYYMPRYADGRERSILLSGEWKFRFYDRPEAVPEDFFKGTVTDWERIPVPSCIQNHGYDRHQYINVAYPIPVDPPFVPRDNPACIYETSFQSDKKERDFLYFEGVDSCFYVWVNGSFAGYSQVSHSSSEFEITSLVEKGDNLLSVLVLKYCDGTYLEDQDKLRMTGIFRDVWLLHRPKSHVVDFTVTTSLEGEGARLTLDLFGDEKNDSLPVTVTLKNDEGDCLFGA